MAPAPLAAPRAACASTTPTSYRMAALAEPEEVRAYLVAAAKAGVALTYSELLERLGYAFSRPKMRALCAILGTVDECVEQLKAHLAVGVQKLIFVPYRYEMEQIEIIAREIIPRLKNS